MQSPIDAGVSNDEADDTAPSSATTPRLLLRVDEVAEVLGISRSTVYELLYAGALTSVRIGAARRVRQRDLEAFVRDLVDVS
jgi:excisionase family DNA binding protein